MVEVVPQYVGIRQPWNQVVFPPEGSNWGFVPGVSARVARSIPGFGRALALIAGMIRQCPMEAYRGLAELSRPRLLEAPDPDRGRAWFVGVQVEDYLLHGNAIHYVTTMDAAGWPATVAHVPAEWVTVLELDGELDYWARGRRLDPARVVHVRRGVDPEAPWRGVGVIEQHTGPLARIRDQESYEAGVMRGSSVPSVAVIAPNGDLSQREADEAAGRWVDRYGGPHRMPAILPAGTQVIPLSWSPHDSEMTEARKLGLQDLANALNLDGFWLGAPAGSYTYKSPGPMYLNLVRQTLGPILDDVEQSWSAAWLPRGQRVRFDRSAMLQDDLPTMVGAVRSAVEAGLLTLPEGRELLGFPVDPPSDLAVGATLAPTVPAEGIL